MKNSVGFCHLNANFHRLYTHVNLGEADGDKEYDFNLLPGFCNYKEAIYSITSESEFLNIIVGVIFFLYCCVSFPEITNGLFGMRL